MVRTFISVDLALPGLGPGFASPEAPTHLTLAFLGEVEESRVPPLVASLGPALAGTAPFRIVARGVGAFPSVTRPRVVWVGVQEGAEELRDIAGRVRGALASGGFAFDAKPFVPHATVLRVRSPADRRLAEALLARSPAEPLGERVVDAVDVKGSLVGHGGATHRVLARIGLAARTEEPSSAPARESATNFRQR